MEDFPGNSLSPKKSENPKEVENPKKIEKVTTGPVIRRKKPLGKRFMETFVGADAKSVWSFVALDVLIPAAKDMAADAVSQGIERMLFGEARSSSRRTGHRPGGSNGFVSYNRYSSGGVNVPVHRREESSRHISHRARASHNFDEIILATRVEAEEAIDRMFDLLSRYEAVSVADLYGIIDVSSEYTDRDWGWTDLRGAGVTRVRSGYLLDLPRPEPLK